MMLDSSKIASVRLTDFNPHHPALDPTMHLASAFRTFKIQAIPDHINASTPPPQSRKAAAKYPDSAHWSIAHDKELDQLEQQQAFQWIPDTHKSKITKPIALTITYRYKRNEDGLVIGRKARCSIRGDLMKAKVHYDPDHIASYAADKTSIRALICLATASSMPLRHIDISSAFTAEKYSHNQPVYVRQTPRFDGSLTHPHCTYGKLILNLYGSKPASIIYFTGLQSHLKANGYNPLQTDPCVFTKTTHQGTVTAGITTDDFLISAPSNKLIDEFSHMLKKIHRQGSRSPYDVPRLDNTPPRNRSHAH